MENPLKEEGNSGKLASSILKILGAYGLLMFALVFLIIVVWGAGTPKERATILMASGLILLWCITGGFLMHKFRDRVKKKVWGIKLNWQLTFVLFCTSLALLEEAVTTAMTNLAPLFGVAMGEAFITASPNYLEVVLLNSVIVFWPAYVAWAWLLKRYDFHPNWVMLLYGLTGTFGEALSFGLSNLTQVGMWTYVYGLMVYLPAYCVPENRGARKPAVKHYFLGLILPMLANISFALAVIAVRTAIGY